MSNLWNCPAYKLKQLDPVHNEAIRLCLGAYRSSPMESVYAESGELPLSLRREMLQLQFYARTKQFMPDQLETWLDDESCDNFYNSRPSKRPNVGLVARRSLEQLSIDMPKVELLTESIYGPQMFSDPRVCLVLAEMRKSDTCDEQYRQHFYSHRHACDLEVFTDGSKTAYGVGAGMVMLQGSTPHIHKIGRRLNPIASVFTAELVAIKSAMHLLRSYVDISAVIYSDSKSALEAIQGSSSRGLVIEIRELLVDLTGKGVSVMFCWIPSHLGIAGNELVDSIAKFATCRLGISSQAVPMTDVRSHIRSSVYHKWKDKWLHLIYGLIRS